MICLAVDIGNSRTTYGVFEDHRLRSTFSHETLKDGGNVTADFFHAMSHIPKPDIVGIASVVPEVTKKTGLFIDAMLGKVPIRILENKDIPIINQYYNALDVGIDRLLASFAAYEQWGRSSRKPLIVIDFGTATTFNCISAEGQYTGGAISLGVQSSAFALAQLTSQLPIVELVFPPAIVAKTTVESIQSGILNGTLNLVEGMIDKMGKEVFPDAPMVIATGGLARIFEGRSNKIDHFEPHLLLEGIRRVLQG